VFSAGREGLEGFMRAVTFHLGSKAMVRLHKHDWKEKHAGQRTPSDKGYRGG
jgi:hypothetical protein